MDRKYAIKTVIIPIDALVYNEIIGFAALFQAHLDSLIEQYPEIFPHDIARGYILCGGTKPCKKVQVLRRRIFLKYSKEEYLIQIYGVVLSKVFIA